MAHSLSVREIQAADIPLLVEYLMGASDAHLLGMGVDLAKMPSGPSFTQRLTRQLTLPYAQKPAFAVIWEANGQPVGHANLNNIRLGEAAYMHLHMWQGDNRQQGMGTELLRLSIPLFFQHFDLKTLYCEPYALNPAPNKTLPKVGFTFVKRYMTIPGSLSFEQEVNRWELTRAQFISRKGNSR